MANVATWMVGMERFFGLVVFNYIYANGDDLGLDGGLSPNIRKSNVYDDTGHPCRVDFERFGERIGLLKYRIARILDRYMTLPEMSSTLMDRSFLDDKGKRHYRRIVNERIARFARPSE